MTTTLTTTDLRILQDGSDTVTPGEVVRIVRASGRDVTPRMMSFLQTQEVVPTADRIGSRGGQLPAIVIDLTIMIYDMRARGTRLGAIRELLPLWSSLVSGQIRGMVNLSALEFEARKRSLSEDAVLNVPALVEHVLGGMREEHFLPSDIMLKDGSIVDHTVPFTVKFLFGSTSLDTGVTRIDGWSQIAIPGLSGQPALNDPALIVLGVPLGIDLIAEDHFVVHRPRPTRTRPRVRRQLEELPFDIAN